MFEVVPVCVVMPVFRHDFIYFNQSGADEIQFADAMVR